MLCYLRRSLDRNQQIMYIGLMLIELNDFFNVRGNMNDKQIQLTAELILDNPNFHDLTLGNIKACFREKMMSARLYDRLDGNIIIGWLRQFKSDMADHCETVNEGRDRERLREESKGDTGAITHATYMAMLESRANDGDPEAQRILAECRRHSAPPDAAGRRKELDFFRYKQQYLKERKEREQ